MTCEPPMRLFVYELLCAGGLGVDAPESLQREGWAMLSAIANDFAQVPGVDVWTLLRPSCPALGHVCRYVAPEEEQQAFRTLAALADATLVIAPEFHHHLLDRSRAVLAVGGHLLGCMPPAIELTADKLTLARHWHARGVPTPQTELMPGDIPLPCVYKPRYGAGSQATFLVPSLDQWSSVRAIADSEYLGLDMITQPYVNGVTASIGLLLGRATCIPLLPGRQLLSNDGRFHYQGGVLPLPEALARRAVALAQQAVAGIAGLQGFVGVDMVLGDIDMAIEINPRLTTSYLGLRHLCRDNLGELWLRLARAEPATTAWQPGPVRFRADGTIA
jgi:tyramine---L-glutamate ligase